MKKVCAGPLEFTPYRPWSTERRSAARERARGGPYWIGERPAIVRRMWNEGATFKAIAEHLGGISRSAVAGFIRRNGLLRSPKQKSIPLECREEFIDRKSKELGWDKYRTIAGFENSKSKVFALRCGCDDAQCRGWKLVAPRDVAEHMHRYGNIQDAVGQSTPEKT